MEQLILDFDIPVANAGDFELVLRREVMTLSGVSFKLERTGKPFGRLPYRIIVQGSTTVVSGWGNWFLNTFCQKYACLDYSAKQQVEAQFKAFENAVS